MKELGPVLSFLVDKPLAIAGVLAGAVIVGKLARRLVKLLVRRLGRRQARRGPGVLRRHTPPSLLDTGELVSTRTTQRIGFGAQSLIRDFLAGVFILVEDQFGVGDWVDLGEVTGSVEAVTLRRSRPGHRRPPPGEPTDHTPRGRRFMATHTLLKATLALVAGVAVAFPARDIAWIPTLLAGHRARASV
ncbi:MAG TPA: mechanosensitive ion channel domain-containing protein [Solirubrobacteraceae bacterium]|nr:mechanosensitive ion channel domain-containing protein [Solirubrobacteraceae bacterium]